MATACYLYGVIDADASLPPDLHGPGRSGDEVRKVPFGDVAAVVGDVPDRERGGREDLLAHHRIVDALAAGTDVLPMRFGAVLPDPDAVVREFLEPQHDRLREVLGQLRGHEQFTLEVRYDREVVLREIVESNPQVARLREATRDRAEDESRVERMRLGELVVAALEQRRAADAARLVDVLAPHTVAAAPGDTGEADMVLRSAFLVARAHRGEFEAAVESLGRSGNGRLRLRLLGPQPPYDFVGGG